MLLKHLLNNTIIINDNCIPDENEINYQITLYRINKAIENQVKDINKIVLLDNGSIPKHKDIYDLFE